MKLLLTVPRTTLSAVGDVQTKPPAKEERGIIAVSRKLMRIKEIKFSFLIDPDGKKSAGQATG